MRFGLRYFGISGVEVNRDFLSWCAAFAATLSAVFAIIAGIALIGGGK